MTPWLTGIERSRVLEALCVWRARFGRLRGDLTPAELFELTSFHYACVNRGEREAFRLRRGRYWQP